MFWLLRNTLCMFLRGDTSLILRVTYSDFNNDTPSHDTWQVVSIQFCDCDPSDLGVFYPALRIISISYCQLFLICAMIDFQSAL